MSKFMHFQGGKLLIAMMAGSVLLVTSAAAQSRAAAPATFTLGSSNTVTADPSVPRPSTKPCLVPLFTNFVFQDFNPQFYSYTPPTACPGPWAKVVLVADFHVTAGVQFDRTGQISLGHVNIYYGTTPEPGSVLAPRWHIERDLTDYTSLFVTAQSGEVDLFNLVNTTYTSIIYGSAALQFYPVPSGGTTPLTADSVYPLPDAPGGAVTLSTTSSQLSQTFTLPLNVQNAYLDVLTQNQSGDEFWYTCVPNDVMGELFSCGNTGFREAEISIDGTPAGVAPVYPWIFTGGIDPFLWFPLPGVQALDLVPYRVDLTPFAGTLSNGQQHTVAVSVFNANNYFLATASLLVYLDHGSTQVTGAVTANTLTSAPNPVVVENLQTGGNGQITGTVTVTSDRSFQIAGFVNTSHGTVTTSLSQTVNFSNNQQFNISSTQYDQFITQLTSVNSTTTVTGSSGPTTTMHSFNYPLTVNISQTTLSNGNITQLTDIKQQYADNLNETGGVTFSRALSNLVSSEDQLTFDSSFQLVNHTHQHSLQNYVASDSTGYSYACLLNAANNVLKKVSAGCP